MWEDKTKNVHEEIERRKENVKDRQHARDREKERKKK